jgi:hypothetical protein
VIHIGKNLAKASPPEAFLFESGAQEIPNKDCRNQGKAAKYDQDAVEPAGSPPVFLVFRIQDRCN